MEKYLLTEMNWKEVEETIKKTNMAIIPSGSLHPHGLGCPMGLEYILSQELADSVGKRTGVLVLPSLIYGYVQHHGSFPGTIGIKRTTLTDMLIDICEWLQKWGVKKIVHIPVHGGNNPALEEAAYYCRSEWNMLSAALKYGVVRTLKPELAKYHRPGEGLTYGLSLMLYLRPDLVDSSKETFKMMKRTFGDKFELLDHSVVKFEGATVNMFLQSKDLSDTCAWGIPIDEVNYVTESSAELGEEIFTTAVEYMVAFIEAFKKIEIPPPY